jgi:hypothetical protein
MEAGDHETLIRMNHAQFAHLAAGARHGRFSDILRQVQPVGVASKCSEDDARDDDVMSKAEGTAEQRWACEQDAFKFCGKEIPSVQRVTACMTTADAMI